MAGSSIQDGSDPAIQPRHLSNANLSISHTTGGLASNFDSAADFEELPALEMPLDSTPRSFPTSNNFPIRTHTHFTNSFSGDCSPFDPNYVIQAGEQTYSIDPSQVYNSILSVSSRSTAEPWTSLASTGVPAKPVSENRKQLSQRGATIQSKANDTQSDHFNDSALGTLQDSSQYDAGSQMDTPTDMNPIYYQGPPGPLQPQEVLEDDQFNETGEDDDDDQGNVSMQNRSRHATKKEGNLACDVPGCTIKVKTLSDMKKHQARHTKCFRCQVPGCSRQQQGFATVNDLERHEKSVHQKDTRKTKSYRCFASGCAKSEKVWPRLDNFKQHLTRMHPLESIESLLELSDRWYQTEYPAELSQSQSVDDVIHTQQRKVKADSRRAKKEAVRRSRLTVDQQAHQAPLEQPQRSFPSLQIPQQPPAQDLNYLSPTAPQPSSIQRSGPLRGHTVGGQSGHRSRQGPYTRPQTSRTGNTTMSPHPQPMSRSVSDVPQHGGRRYTTTRVPDVPNTFGHPTDQPIFEDLDSYTPQVPITQSMFDPTEFEIASQLFGFEPSGRARTAPDGNAMRDYQARMMRETEPIPPQHNPALDNYDSDLFAQIGAGNETTMQSSPASGNQPLTPTIKINGQSDDKIRDCQEVKVQELLSFLDQLKDKHHDKGSVITLDEIQEKIRHTFEGSFGTASLAGITSDNSSVNCPKIGRTHYRCKTCGVFKLRKSELKKHEKRHSRPYGCVLDNCYKSFGSKNDWKRHEQTHPEQKECFRCDGKHIDPTSGQWCQKVFYNGSDHYQKHLRKCGIAEHLHAAILLQRRVRGNNNSCFWCGFCDDIVQHGLTGIDGLNKRLHHIDQHFQQEEKKVADWIELAGGGKTKLEVQKENNDAKIRQVHAQLQPATNEDDAVDSQGSSSSSSSPREVQSHPPHACQTNQRTAQQNGQRMQRQLSHASTNQQAHIWTHSQQQQQHQQVMMEQQQHRQQHQQQRGSQSSQSHRSQHTEFQDSIVPRVNAAGQRLGERLTCCDCENEWTYSFGGVKCPMCPHVWCRNCRAE